MSGKDSKILVNVKNMNYIVLIIILGLKSFIKKCTNQLPNNCCKILCIPFKDLYLQVLTHYTGT